MSSIIDVVCAINDTERLRDLRDVENFELILMRCCRDRDILEEFIADLHLEDARMFTLEAWLFALERDSSTMRDISAEVVWKIRQTHDVELALRCLSVCDNFRCAFMLYGIDESVDDVLDNFDTADDETWYGILYQIHKVPRMSEISANIIESEIITYKNEIPTDMFVEVLRHDITHVLEHVEMICDSQMSSYLLCADVPQEMIEYFLPQYNGIVHLKDCDHIDYDDVTEFMSKMIGTNCTFRHYMPHYNDAGKYHPRLIQFMSDDEVISRADKIIKGPSGIYVEDADATTVAYYCSLNRDEETARRLYNAIMSS